MTIRVGVNLLWLAPGRVGGSEEYLVRQLSGLADLGPECGIEPVLFCQPALPDAHPELVVRIDTHPFPIDRDWRGVRVLAEHTWLPTKLRRFDVVHHGGGTVPVGGRGPAVLTVHDLQYLVFPEYFSAARLRYLDLMMPRSVRRAAVVATPSEYVRSTVIGAFDVDPAAVVVVPHGIPELVVPDQGAIASVRQRFGLGDRPYVVYPAITHPHKGHTVIVEMMRDLPDTSLLLIGGEGSAEPDVRAAMASFGAADRVARTGRVPSADRDALIAGAEALVFPSEYEGFGAPVVEAMALDTPVVCGAAPALREVTADAGIIVPDRDPGSWAKAVSEAGSRREDLVARGRLRRRAFTIAASGEAIASAYRSAAAS